MNRSVEIRRCGVQDVENVADLFDQYRRFYRQPSDRTAAAGFLRERLAREESVLFAAVDGDRWLGLVHLYPSFSSVSMKRLWILNDLFVAQESRGQGVGRRLLDAARRWAVETSAKGLVLETESSNTGAQRLYEAVGYRRLTNVFYEQEV